MATKQLWNACNDERYCLDSAHAGPNLYSNRNSYPKCYALTYSHAYRHCNSYRNTNPHIYGNRYPGSNTYLGIFRARRSDCSGR